MPEVEDRAAALIEGISQAHRRLERGAGPNHRVVFELPERTAGEQSRLDDFRHALTSLRLTQRGEHVRIDDDARRRVECADEVLPGRAVDGGLAADCRVDMAVPRR